MNDMGDKINSKRIAKAAGCFVIPGYEGEVPDEGDPPWSCPDILTLLTVPYPHHSLSQLAREGDPP